MNKIIIIAALLAASFSAKAQTKETVFSKCFCETKAVKYQLFPQGESLAVGDTTYFLDWRTREVVENGKVYKMQSVTPYADAIEVEYNDMTLTILYKKNQFWDYIIER